jgi:hypothetical protein
MHTYIHTCIYSYYYMYENSWTSNADNVRVDGLVAHGQVWSPMEYAALIHHRGNIYTNNEKVDVYKSSSIEINADSKVIDYVHMLNAQNIYNVCNGLIFVTLKRNNDNSSNNINNNINIKMIHSQIWQILAMNNNDSKEAHKHIIQLLDNSM